MNISKQTCNHCIKSVILLVSLETLTLMPWKSQACTERRLSCSFGGSCEGTSKLPLCLLAFYCTNQLWGGDAVRDTCSHTTHFNDSLPVLCCKFCGGNHIFKASCKELICREKFTIITLLCPVATSQIHIYSYLPLRSCWVAVEIKQIIRWKSIKHSSA